MPILIFYFTVLIDVIMIVIIIIYYYYSQTLYERLFQLIVSRVNRALSVADTLTTSVSILDFYGFEAFETNR